MVVNHHLVVADVLVAVKEIPGLKEDFFITEYIFPDDFRRFTRRINPDYFDPPADFMIL